MNSNDKLDGMVGKAAPLAAAPSGVNFVTVPIKPSFSSNEVIGNLTIDKSRLPLSPNFTFALAYMGEKSGPPGSLQTKPYKGPYALVCVALASDELYAKYLAQIGVSGAAVERDAASPEDRYEQFIQAEIARSPDALRELGEYLGRVLDEDEFPRANSLLLQLAREFQPLPADSLMGAIPDLVLQWRHNAQGCGRSISDQHAAGTWRSCARELAEALAAQQQESGS